MSDEQPFPPVSKELLDALDKAFPDKSPDLSTPVDMIRHRGGQVSVVRFMKRQYEEQNDKGSLPNVLNP